MPTHPPSPASSLAVVWQPLCSPSAHHLCCGITSLPVSIGAVAGGSPVSASSLRVQNSALARLPSGSTMAPSSLLSAMAHQSTGSSGLPRPTGFALVCRLPSTALGLHSSSYTSSLRPADSVRLLLPFGSSVLCRYGSTAAFRIPASAYISQHRGGKITDFEAKLPASLFVEMHRLR